MNFAGRLFQKNNHHVLTFARVSAGVNELPADPGALQEPRAASAETPACPRVAPCYAPARLCPPHKLSPWVPELLSAAWT